MPIFNFIKNLFGGGENKEENPADNWLLSGTWLTLASSWLESARYLYTEEILEIALKQRFKGGTHGIVYLQYDNVNYDTARGLYETDSPGRWLWSNLYYSSYVVLSGLVSTPVPGKPKPTVVRVREDLIGQNFPKGLLPNNTKRKV